MTDETKVVDAPKSDARTWLAVRRLKDDLHATLTDERVAEYLEAYALPIQKQRDAAIRELGKTARELGKAESESAALREQLSKLLTAVACIHHWHDTTFNKATGETEGMVVSAAAVRNLWKVKAEVLAALEEKP